MWKDFFYYSKSERRVIVLLLILASILVAANLYGLWKEEKDREEYSAGIAHAADSQADKRPAADRHYADEKHATPEKESPHTASEAQHKLKPFDPNTATREELARQGLSDYVVGNILKYRGKGGKFRTPESLQKIYGMDKASYEAVAPRITIGQEYRLKERKPQPQYERIQKFAPGTIVNINTADTTTLKRIPGIGSTYARRIINYRTRLGGFHSVDQLQEIRGIDASLNRWFETGNTPLQKIKVNHATLNELRQHPYMNYNRAKSITDYRKRFGSIRDIRIFDMFESFTRDDIERIMPYVSFE